MSDSVENLLRKINGEEKQEKQNEPKKNNKLEVVSTKKQSDDKLESLFMKMKEASYSKEDIVYIDTEVCAAFRRIKNVYKVNLGQIFSSLGEAFLLKHAEELKVKTSKTNKFLDA